MPSADTVYILLGSNLGDRELNLRSAIRAIGRIPGTELRGASPVYVSLPEDMSPDAPPFLNQALEIGYDYTPQELLSHTEKIEIELGRDSKGDKSSRSIDIDILLFGNQIVTTPDLVIPHPRLTRRGFALAPLLDLNPSLVDPSTQLPLAGFLTPTLRKKVALYRDLATV